MNVLIVGYKGFIGQNLFYQLKENKKFNILLLDKDSSRVDVEDKICKEELIFLTFCVNKEKLPKDRFKNNYKINIIGSRHGEKKHESLLTREEIFRAKDLGRYFKIASDIRNLNYELYFSKGNKKISKLEDYSSNTVKQLNQSETEKMLINLDLINSKKEKYIFN